MKLRILIIFLLKCIYAMSGHQHYGFRLIASKPHIIDITKNRRIKFMIDIDGTICNKTNSDFEGFIYNKAQYLIFKEQFEDAINLLINHKNKIKFLVILIELYFNMGKSKEALNLLNNARDKIKNDNDFHF